MMSARKDGKKKRERDSAPGEFWDLIPQERRIYRAYCNRPSHLTIEQWLNVGHADVKMSKHRFREFARNLMECGLINWMPDVTMGTGRAAYNATQRAEVNDRWACEREIKQRPESAVAHVPTWKELDRRWRAEWVREEVAAMTCAIVKTISSRRFCLAKRAERAARRGSSSAARMECSGTRMIA
jgi:hypothetical protein